MSKTYRVHLNFNGGPAYFYIPPNNFYGEVVDYNFLVSKAKWNAHARTGKLSWDTSSLTVINPNKTFCRHFKKVDDYLKNACYENNINIETELTLVEVRKVFLWLLRMTMSQFSAMKVQANSFRDLILISTH